MIYPPLDELLKKTDSKYTLVVLTAKRARELAQGAIPTVDKESEKKITIAIEEIAKGNFKFSRDKE